MISKLDLSQRSVASHSRLMLAGACLQWFALDAEAAPGVWRCGNSYHDRPCQHGRPLDVEDGRTDEQKREADQAAKDSRATAERMERERLRLESKAGAAVLIDDTAYRPKQPSLPAASSEPLRIKPRKDTIYMAPGTAPAKRRKKPAKG